MSIAVTWDGEDKTVIRLDVRNGWTCDEFESALAQSIDMSHNEAHSIFIILNPVQNAHPPENWLQYLTSKKSWGDQNHINALLIVSPANIVIRTVQNLMQGQKQVIFVSTLDEAYHLIAQRQNQT